MTTPASRWRELTLIEKLLHETAEGRLALIKEVLFGEPIDGISDDAYYNLMGVEHDLKAKDVDAADLNTVQSVLGQLEAVRRIINAPSAASSSETEHNEIVEKCAKVCDDVAKLQSEMASDAGRDDDLGMERYRKARAWDASILAVTIRNLKVTTGGERAGGISG